MNKIINLNIVPKDLFKKWLQITQIFHELKPQEIEILSLFLYHHFKLKQEITNNKILWKVLFDYDTKKDIAEELNIDPQSIRNALTVYRKKHLLIDGKLSEAVIPNITKKDNNFKIIFNFNLVHE